MNVILPYHGIIKVRIAIDAKKVLLDIKTFRIRLSGLFFGTTPNACFVLFVVVILGE